MVHELGVLSGFNPDLGREVVSFPGPGMWDVGSFCLMLELELGCFDCPSRLV